MVNTEGAANALSEQPSHLLSEPFQAETAKHKCTCTQPSLSGMADREWDGLLTQHIMMPSVLTVTSPCSLGLSNVLENWD